MISVEINKYPPSVFRKGLLDEWISCDQIAQGKVSKEQYLLVESKYVSAIGRIAAKHAFLVARNIESWGGERSLLSELELDDVLTDVQAPVENQPIDQAMLDNLIRRCLRGVAWMEIGVPNELMIHFGYDLRIVVVSASDLAVVLKEVKEQDGLFVYESRANLETVKGWFRPT